MNRDRFDDLDLREEPAGTDRSNTGAATQIDCTQYTFICAAELGRPPTLTCCV